MKDNKIRTKFYHQTDLLDYLKNNSDIYERYRSLSIKKLTKIAQYHKISRRSNMSREKLVENILLFEKDDLSVEEWKKILGKGWVPLSGTQGFCFNDKSMIIGYLNEFNAITEKISVLQKFSLLVENYTIEILSNLATRKNSNIIVSFYRNSYSFPLLGEACRVLGKSISILQNEDGLLMCKNQNKFILITPMEM